MRWREGPEEVSGIALASRFDGKVVRERQVSCENWKCFGEGVHPIFTNGLPSNLPYSAATAEGRTTLISKKVSANAPHCTLNKS